MGRYEEVKDPRLIYDAKRKIQLYEQKGRIASRQGLAMEARFYFDQANRIRKIVLNRFGILID